MKKQICLALIFLIFGFASVSGINAQETVLKEDFGKLSLNVELNKSEYIPLEPLFVQIKVSNQTQDTLSLLSIPDFKRLFVEVTSNGITKTVGSLYTSGPGRGSFPVEVKKGQAFSKAVALEVNLSKMFPEPGQYQMRFVLYNGRDKGLGGQIKSEIKEITIKKPTGIDKVAIEFLRKNMDQSSDVLFWWKDQNKWQELMEKFVQDYSESEIGEYAIFQLGISYSNGGELDKAETEFEKIKNSSNKYISDNANKSLAEIKQKKTDLEKVKNP